MNTQRRRGTFSRSEAARIALLGQGVFAAGVIVAVAVFLLWPSDGGAELTESAFERRLGSIDEQARERLTEDLIAQASEAPESGDGFEPDIIGIAERLALVGRIEQPEPLEPATVTPPDAVETPEDAPPEESTPDDEAPAQKPQSRYLGLVTAGSSAWGLLAVGESQGMIRVGAKRTFDAIAVSKGSADGGKLVVEVVEATEETAVVLENGIRFELEKAARSDAAFSVASAESPEEAAAANTRTMTQAGVNARTMAKGGTPSLPPRPRAEDFRNADGELDRDAYRQALREYSQAARNSIRGNQLRPAGGGRDGSGRN